MLRWHLCLKTADTTMLGVVVISIKTRSTSQTGKVHEAVPWISPASLSSGKGFHWKTREITRNSEIVQIKNVVCHRMDLNRTCCIEWCIWVTSASELDFWASALLFFSIYLLWYGSCFGIKRFGLEKPLTDVKTPSCAQPRYETMPQRYRSYCTLMHSNSR